MPATLRSSRNVFGPTELARLATAYDAALSTVTEDHRGAGLTGREIRRQLAAVIMAEAKCGQLDPERLKQAALHSLEKPFADPELLR